MNKRKVASQAIVTRFIKAALAAGLRAGEFDVEADGDRVTILTHPAAAAPSEPGEDAWRERMAKWRRSA